MASSILTSFSREYSNHRKIFLSEDSMSFFITSTKPNTKYFLTKYLLLNK